MDGTDTSAGIDYSALLHAALVDVVRRVLALAAEHGLPGEHQLYLAFGTGADGVELSAGLHRQYPDEMTIVLQHQFWNLVVDDAGFAVTLRFGGKPERLVVPWSALRSFADPSVNFGFRLQQPGRAEQETDEKRAAEKQEATAGPSAVPPAEPGKVADIRKFQKRRPADKEP
jgi:hypothetical protein